MAENNSNPPREKVKATTICQRTPNNSKTILLEAISEAIGDYRGKIERYHPLWTKLVRLFEIVVKFRRYFPRKR